MLGPDVALAASARDWPDKFHRYLLDHGGGRVSARVMGADQALTAEFDVLIIDDICSFLTPRLVRRLREAGCGVVGVFSPGDGPDAKRRLLECGISDVVEEDASPEEFLRLISSTLDHRPVIDQPAADWVTSGYRVTVASAATGSGSTEVSLALANRLSRRAPTVLIDLDQSHPGLAQRLGLSLHPNLLTAVDFSHHDVDRLSDSLHHVGEVAVIGGLVTPAGGNPLRPHEITGLLEDLGAMFPIAVLDLGEGEATYPTQAKVLVAEATPVGLARVIAKAEREIVGGGVAPLVVVNRLNGGGRRSDDIRAELAAALPGLASVVLPNDRRLDRAAWDGLAETSGPFARAVGRIADLIADAAA